MKKISFNIKDRKVLYGILTIALVCVFTLTIAYAALNAVLTIQGSAQVSSADWDIHLANPIVKSGSVTTDVPVITSGRTLTFSTTLNMPGDYYEFTVDVVNSGTIDGMIEKVTKTPELTSEQAKYLKYEVSYANGESISTKQNIASGVTMPIKVRVEYRKDLTGSDLPSGQVVLNLSLVLDYTQSDGTASTVTGNGASIADVKLDISGWTNWGEIHYINSSGNSEFTEFSHSTGETQFFEFKVIRGSKFKIMVHEWFSISLDGQMLQWVTDDPDGDGYFVYELDIIDDCTVSISIDD